MARPSCTIGRVLHSLRRRRRDPMQMLRSAVSEHKGRLLLRSFKFRTAERGGTDVARFYWFCGATAQQCTHSAPRPVATNKGRVLRPSPLHLQFHTTSSSPGVPVIQLVREFPEIAPTSPERAASSPSPGLAYHPIRFSSCSAFTRGSLYAPVRVRMQAPPALSHRARGMRAHVQSRVYSNAPPHSSRDSIPATCAILPHSHGERGFRPSSPHRDGIRRAVFSVRKTPRSCAVGLAIAVWLWHWRARDDSVLAE